MGKAIAMIMYAEIVKNALLLVRVEINFIDFPNLDKKNLDNYNFTQPIKMNEKLTIALKRIKYVYASKKYLSERDQREPQYNLFDVEKLLEAQDLISREEERNRIYKMIEWNGVVVRPGELRGSIHDLLIDYEKLKEQLEAK